MDTLDIWAIGIFIGLIVITFLIHYNLYFFIKEEIVLGIIGFAVCCLIIDILWIGLFFGNQVNVGKGAKD